MTNHPNRSWRARVAAEADALGPDLVRAWMDLYLPHGISAAGLGRSLALRLNVARYDGNILLRWRRGAEPVPAPVAALMRREVLEALFGVHLGDAVARVMEPPARD